MNLYLYYLIFVLLHISEQQTIWNQWYSNIPTYDNYEFTYGEYSWRNSSTAHLSIFNKKKFCCATLLTLEHGLTVASCFEPDLKDIKEMVVVGGSTHLREHDPRAQVREIKELVIHEEFKRGRFDGNNPDIAIIVMSSPFVETYRVKPALLPEKYYMDSSKFQAFYQIYFRITDNDKMWGKINVDGFRFKGQESYKCTHCDKYRGKQAQFNRDGVLVSRYTCLRPRGNRYESDVQYPCYNADGCPVLTFDRHIVLMEMYYLAFGCRTFKFKNVQMPALSAGCADEAGNPLLIQVFPHVKWIRSKLITKKVIRFRPYRIPTKKINITPHMPLVVYIILLAIAFIVFLICNRAVFGRIRF